LFSRRSLLTMVEDTARRATSSFFKVFISFSSTFPLVKALTGGTGFLR
jgi:hypothetical protein